MHINFNTDRKYKLLDLYCCAGAGAKGYYDAGFEVVGVDIVNRPNYPYTFIQADAIEILKDKEFINQFDAIHASPPCQAYTKLKFLSGDLDKWKKNHVDLVGPTRDLLNKTEKPWIMENVPGAPLKNYIQLFGSQFPNLYTQRERWFESNIILKEPDVAPVRHKTAPLGQGIGEDGFVTVAGNKPIKGLNKIQTKLYYGLALGGIDWMDLEELTQAIPPAYTEFLGYQMIDYLEGRESHKETEIKFDLSPEFIELVMKYINKVS